MALRRPINLIPFLHLQAIPITQTSHPSSPHPQTSNTDSPKPRNFSLNTNPPSNNHSDIVESLITIFTKKSQTPLDNNTQLQILATRLTTQTVETVLKSFKSWRIAHEFFTWAAAQQHLYKHNCYTYNTMASILSNARKPTQLRELSINLLNSRCWMTPGALGFMIRCLGSQGLVDEAIRLFDEANKRRLCVVNSYTYNCLLEAIAKAGRIELLEERLTEMGEAGWLPDKLTLTPVLQAYCNARRFNEALGVFKQIDKQGWADEHVYTVLVVSISKWGEVDVAFELIQTMEDHDMCSSEKTLCTLIHGFVREMRIDKALQLFDKMRELGFSPDLRLYSVLIEGVCQKKEYDKGLYLYSEMKSAGIVPDVSVMTNLISSFCREGDFVTANKVLEDGLKSKNRENSVLLYNTVLHGLVSYGLVEKANLLLRAMMETERDPETFVDDLFKVKEKVFPNCVSFTIVIDGLCKADKLDEGLKVFHDMVRIGCERNTLLYNNLINELCKLDRLEEGTKLLEEMKESGFEPTHFTYNCILGCLCRKKNVPAVLDLIKVMRVCGHEPWIKHCTMLVKQLCTHGNALEACSFLNEMAQEGFLPDIVAYSAAIDGLFRIGEVDRAVELFREIFKRGHSPDLVAYNIVIRGLSKVGRVVESQNYLNEMMEKGLSPSVITYNLMIDGFCKANELDKALLCFKQMVDESREPTVITYTTLIDGMCNAGKPDDALVQWGEMEIKGCAPNKIAYMALVNGLCKCGKPDAARIYFQEMQEKEMRPDIYAYVALISGFISKGNMLSAFEILKDMVGTEEFPGPSDKNYPILIDALCKLSQDSTTSLGVKNLIAEGYIPEAHRVTTTRLEPIV